MFVFRNLIFLIVRIYSCSICVTQNSKMCNKISSFVNYIQLFDLMNALLIAKFRQENLIPFQFSDHSI